MEITIGIAIGIFIGYHLRRKEEPKSVRDLTDGMEVGAEVILTTSSMGKQYKGMSGTIQPRKLLNDNYSVRFENGMELALNINQFKLK